MYVILETVRREDPNDSQKWVSLRSSFLKELEDPVYGDETLTSLLFVMLLSFCNGTMPHYPVKKILLLLWKSVLAMMGGMKELLILKQEAREAVSLEPSFPENVHCKPLVLPQPNYDPRYVTIIIKCMHNCVSHILTWYHDEKNRIVRKNFLRFLT